MSFYFSPIVVVVVVYIIIFLTVNFEEKIDIIDSSIDNQ